MSAIPINAANMQVTLQNDANQMRTIITWLLERYTTYNNQMTAVNLTACGITGADQTAVLAFSADIGRLQAYVTGTAQGVASDIRVDVTNVLGVM